jgi:hypothetical protein
MGSHVTDAFANQAVKVYDIMSGEKEHYQAIMFFVFFGFCVQLVLLVGRCASLLHSARRVRAPACAPQQSSRARVALWGQRTRY